VLIFKILFVIRKFQVTFTSESIVESSATVMSLRLRSIYFKKFKCIWPTCLARDVSCDILYDDVFYVLYILPSIWVHSSTGYLFWFLHKQLETRADLCLDVPFVAVVRE